MGWGAIHNASGRKRYCGNEGEILNLQLLVMWIRMITNLASPPCKTVTHRIVREAKTFDSIKPYKNEKNCTLHMSCNLAIENKEENWLAIFTHYAYRDRLLLSWPRRMTRCGGGFPTLHQRTALIGKMRDDFREIEGNVPIDLRQPH